MIRTLTLILIAGVLAALPQASFAEAVPLPVKDVSASLQDGKLVVRWSPRADAQGTAYYRIYFSDKSILGGGGNYDDFERTTNGETSYTFQTLPFTSRTIYLTVTAVNAAGVEGDSFAEEASVALPALASMPPIPFGSLPSDSSAAPAAASSSSGAALSPFTLIETRSVSETGVALRFSEDVAEQFIETGAFLMVDASGAQLTVKGVEIDGPMIVLKTAPQIAGRVYALGIRRAFASANGSLLAPPLPQATFVGSAPAPASGYIRNPGIPSEPAVRDTAPPEPPANLTLTITRNAQGQRTVRAKWQASRNRAGDLHFYRLQLLHCGAVDCSPPSNTPNFTYIMVGQPSTSADLPLPNDTDRMYNNVTLSAIDIAGNESTAVSATLRLPQSGIGMLGLALASAAFAGSRIARRRRAV